MQSALQCVGVRVLWMVMLPALALAQGNDRDLGLRGLVTRLTSVNLDRPALPGDGGVIDLFSKSGALVGAPMLLVQELRGPNSLPPIDLPGEPNVVAVSPAFVPIIDGFALPELARLPWVGFSLPFEVPPMPGQRLVFQGALLDPTAPNGLAISEATVIDIRANAVVTSMSGPPVANATHGYSVEFADLDGDGTSEVLSGARTERVGGVGEVGRVRIYRDGLAEPWLVLDDPETGMAAARNHFGHALAVLDFDGDGNQDIAVGARGADLSGPDESGKVVVFRGPQFQSSWTLLPGRPEVQGRFGQWLTAGDFDGDGAMDLAISSMRADAPTGELDAGAIEIFYGPIGHLLARRMRLEAPFPQIGAAFGYHMAAADVDRDGKWELVASSPYVSGLPGGADWSGRIDVFRGGRLEHMAGFRNPRPSDLGLLGADLVLRDATGDGIPDIVAGAELDDAALNGQGTVYILVGPDFLRAEEVRSPTPTVEAGFGSGVDVGDFNADGHPDLVVGEFWWSGTRHRQGRVSVLYGPAFTSGPTFVEPTPGLRHQFGRRVRAADLNGDGKDDVLVGVPHAAINGVLTAGMVHHIRF